MLHILNFTFFLLLLFLLLLLLLLLLLPLRRSSPSSWSSFTTSLFSGQTSTQTSLILFYSSFLFTLFASFSHLTAAAAAAAALTFLSNSFFIFLLFCFCSTFLSCCFSFSEWLALRSLFLMLRTITYIRLLHCVVAAAAAGGTCKGFQEDKE